MSQIQSNSVGDAEPHKIDHIDPKTLIFETMLSFPIQVPQEIVLPSTRSHSKQLQDHLRTKVKFFLQYALSNFKYKIQLKQLVLRVSEFDKIKIFNGLSSFQKEIFKIGVVLKHHEPDFCQAYLAGIMLKMILGEQFEESDDEEDWQNP